MYGHNGELPIPVIAAKSPVDCFYAAREAVRIAVEYMTPVILLSMVLLLIVLIYGAFQTLALWMQ